MAEAYNKPMMWARYLRWRGDEEQCLQQLNEITGCLDAMVVNVDAADFYTILGDCVNVGCYSVVGPDAQSCLEEMRRRLNQILLDDSPIDKAVYILECDNLTDAGTFVSGMENFMTEDFTSIFGAGYREDGKFAAHMIAPSPMGSVRMDEPLVLGYGSILRSPANFYTIDHAFDAGGSSICYIAHNAKKERVLIKETYPLQLSRSLTRDAEDRLVPVGKNAKLRQAMAALLGEAVERTKRERELESDLQNKNLEFFEKYVEVFEANNTVYTVYNDFGKGTLAKKRGKVSLKEALLLTDRLLQLLETLHEAGYLHLDISPENILLNTMVDGINSLRFIDLGSLVEKKYIGRTEVFPCKDGYSPTELFGAAASGESRSLIGERTDTFSVGAVLYNLLTGRVTDWETCRRGNKQIVKEDDPGIRLTQSWRVVIQHKVRPDGETVPDLRSEKHPGVSPRVLRALNDFLSTALCNNPYKRFQTAREMREALQNVMEAVDKYDRHFGRMEMPSGIAGYDETDFFEREIPLSEPFMEKAIEAEEKQLKEADRGVLLSYMVERLTKKPLAGPEIVRQKLQEGKTVLLNKYRLRDAREMVRTYVKKYGDQYDEILFLDESDYSNVLFDGSFTGSHRKTHTLHGDERTLLIFYGREEELGNGIAEMVDGAGQQAVSLSFSKDPDSTPPHVIRILPARMAQRISKASLTSMTALAMVPVFFALFVFYLLLTNDYAQRRLMIFLDPMYDPYGDGWELLHIREALSRCQLFSVAQGYMLAENSWGYKLDGGLLLLRGFQEKGFAFMAGLILLTAVILAWGWKAARKNRLSAAAWMLFVSRWLGSIAYNLGLLPVSVPDLWTTPMAIAVNWVLLCLIFVWPRLGWSKKQRVGGWGLLRMGSGIFGHWVFRCIWPYLLILVPGSQSYWANGPLYAAWSLSLIMMADISLERLAVRRVRSKVQETSMSDQLRFLREAMLHEEARAARVADDLTEKTKKPPFSHRIAEWLGFFIVEDEELEEIEDPDLYEFDDEDDFTQI